MTTRPRDRILVVGGGISGITAAIEASEAGVDVVLVEMSATLGGRVAAWAEYFPKLCPPACGLEINLRRVRTSPRIEVLTLSKVVKVGGTPGNLTVTVRRQPRYVDERCTVCGECTKVCPVDTPDDWNAGMSARKAIYLPFAAAHPQRFVIDDGVCTKAECAACVPACPVDAIDLEAQAETLEFDVRSVIWATGWEPPDAKRFEGLGAAASVDVITNVTMERLAAPSGPTEGRIVRPSDGKAPTSVAFVQCAGSRDENYLRQCSGVCCMASLKQARYVRAQYPDADIHVFYIDIRAPGRLEDFYAESQKDPRLHLVRGKVARVSPVAGGLEVEAEDTLQGERVTRTVDLVVLATGMVPVGVGDAEVEGGIRTDEFGFITADQPHPALLSAGCAKHPTDVSACVRDATGAAAKALRFCTV